MARYRWIAVLLIALTVNSQFAIASSDNKQCGYAPCSVVREMTGQLMAAAGKMVEWCATQIRQGQISVNPPQCAATLFEQNGFKCAVSSFATSYELECRFSRIELWDQINRRALPLDGHLCVFVTLSPQKTNVTSAHAWPGQKIPKCRDVHQALYEKGSAQ